MMSAKKIPRWLVKLDDTIMFMINKMEKKTLLIIIYYSLKKKYILLLKPAAQAQVEKQNCL